MIQGQIVQARGPPDFGWDLIFQPKGFDKTYAELDSEVKNTISHRFKAVNALSEYLKENTEHKPPDTKKLKGEL